MSHSSFKRANFSSDANAGNGSSNSGADTGMIFLLLMGFVSIIVWGIGTSRDAYLKEPASVQEIQEATQCARGRLIKQANDAYAPLTRNDVRDAEEECVGEAEAQATGDAQRALLEKQRMTLITKK